MPADRRNNNPRNVQERATSEDDSHSVSAAPDTERAPQLGSEQQEVDALSDQTDAAVEQLVTQTDDLIEQIRADVNAGIDADAAETITALEAVKRDATSLRATLRQRLQSLFQKASVVWQHWREAREKRASQQWEIPDNPVVIRHILKAIKRRDVPLEQCIDLFRKAPKSTPHAFEWESVVEALDKRITTEISQSLREQKFDRAFTLWDGLSFATQDSRRFVEHVLQQLISALSATLPPVQRPLIAKSAVQRRRVFEAVETQMQGGGGRWRLADVYREKKESIRQRLFTETEQFLLAQPLAAVEALATRSPEQQQKILQSWQQHPKIQWAEILTDPEAPTLIDTVRAFPRVERYTHARDRSTVLRIQQRFTPEERAHAYQKAGEPTCTWDALYAYLIVGNMPQSTAEDIRAFTPTQWKYITLSVFAYGEEKIAELWNADALQDLHQKTDGWGEYASVSDRLIDSMKELSPTLRRHLPTQSDGFYKKTDQLANFQRAIQCVPLEQRDALFEVLKPMEHYGGVRYDQPKLTVATIEHFIEYSRLTHTEGTMTLPALFGTEAMFIGDRWEALRAGIVICAESGLMVPASDGDFSEAAKVYARAAKPEQALTNQFWRNCQERSPNLVQTRQYGTGSFEAQPRTAKTIHLMQDFGRFMADIRHDADLTAQFLQLDTKMCDVLTQWADGSIVANTTDAFDLPVIEGIVVRFASQFEHYSSKKKQQMQRFQQLTRTQKQRLLVLSDALSLVGLREDEENFAQLLTFATSEQGEQLAQFLGTTGLRDFAPEATLAMMRRPDCVGLFYYLEPRQIAKANMLSLVERMVTLHDEGFPAALCRSSYKTSGRLGLMSDTYRSVYLPGKLLAWDVTTLVAVASYAAEHDPAIPFVRLIQLSPDAPIETQQAHIRQAAATRSHDVYLHVDPRPQAEIDVMNERRAQTEALTDLVCTTDQIHALRYLAPSAWNTLQQVPEALKLYLTNKQYSFPEAGSTLPQDILTNPTVWQYLFPEELWADAQKMRQALTFVEQARQAVAELHAHADLPWKEWIETMSSAPWLCTPESLQLCGKDHNYDIRWLPQLHVFTQQEWTERVMPELSQYSFEYARALSDFISYCQNEPPLFMSQEDKEQLISVVRPIPWRHARALAEYINYGESVAASVADIDESEKESYSSAWNDARRASILRRSGVNPETFLKELLLPLAELEQTMHLPLVSLQRLERLIKHFYHSLFDASSLETAMRIVQHSNGALVTELLIETSRGFALQTPEQLLRFCDQLTPELAERIRAFPPAFRIDAADMIDFFQHPHAEAILALFQELQAMFGTHHSMSAYDVLIMDPETDIANIQELKRSCHFPLTSEYLGAVLPITTGTMRTTLTKLNTIFHQQSVIDIVESTTQLAALEPSLHAAVLRQKGPKNFGWSVLSHRQAILEKQVMSQEEVDELIWDVYTNNRHTIPPLDAETACSLLRKSNRAESSHREECITDMFKHYAGDWPPLLDVLYANPTELARIAQYYWNDVPAAIKTDEHFWQILLREFPLVFIEHYQERVATVALTPEVVDRVIETGGAVHMNALIESEQQGGVVLTSTQRSVATHSYIEKSASLDAWAEHPHKRGLLQAECETLLSSWSRSVEERAQIRAQLVRAGIFDESMQQVESAQQSQPLAPIPEGMLVFSLLATSNQGIQALGGEPELDRTLGSRASALLLQSAKQLTQLNRALVKSEFARLATSLASDEAVEVTTENWLPWVMAFVRTTLDDHELPAVTESVRKQAVEFFQRTEVKDLCFTQLQQLWQTYLQAGQLEQPPLSLLTVSGFVADCEGAGALSQFEALSLFMHQFQTSVNQPKTTKGTRVAVMEHVGAMETRFDRESWLNEDRADFYNVSRDILQAAPSLFDDFLQLFQDMTPSEFSRFHDDIYPLYRAQLAVMDRVPNRAGEATFKPRELVAVRKSLRAFARTRRANPSATQELRQHLVDQLTTRFKTRFGITRIPESFSSEHVRSLTNITLYLASLHDRTPEREQLLGWYLALMLNNQWDAYRRGEELHPKDYLIPAHAATVAAMLEQRQKSSPLTPERLGIPPEDMTTFQSLLQTESEAFAIGDVETIDVKLSNVMTNMRTLEDLDLYPAPLDKQRMQLLLEFGNKQVSVVVAKLFQQLRNPDRAVEWTAEERAVRDRVEAMLKENNIPLTADAVKTHAQDGMKQFAVVVNLLRLIEEHHAEEELTALRTVLRPSDEVIAIFQRLGEGFKAHSGAQALTQDLNYLDTVIVKREDEVSESERALLKEYVARIRTHVVRLQTVHDAIKAKFNSVSKGLTTGGNEALREKLLQLVGIVNAEAKEQSVVSTMTHELNPIIENIRECLSCTRDGCNNDTNLTFGDSNKFFLYTHSETQRKGSIADQIVFLEPLFHPSGADECSFVFDRVYGTCTPFILTNHIAAVYKKCLALKKRFPHARLSLFVTDAALATGGVKMEQLMPRLQEALGKQIVVEETDANVDMVASAAGDHYIEFAAEGARTSGPRATHGLLIHVPA